MTVSRRRRPAFAWGVDVDTCALHLAVLHVASGGWQANSAVWSSRASDRAARRRDVPVLTGAARLVAQRQRLVPFLTAMAGHFPPVTIAVENPMGRHPNPALVMAAGVAVEAIGAVALACDLPEPWLVDVGLWKRALGLKINCPKADVAAWAIAAGMDRQAPQDHADALGVSAAALTLVGPGLGIAPRMPSAPLPGALTA